MHFITILFVLLFSSVHLQSVEEEAEVLYDNSGEGGDGPKTAALVDGETAEKGEHPWHVGLVREESKTGFLGWFRHLGGLIRTTTYCGATLVSNRWLVTAAHCIKSTDRTVDLRVVMGSSKRARYFYYFFQTDSIDEIHIHPEYNTESHAYDIALLRLKKMPNIKPGELWPACLPTAPVNSYAGRTATVVGWGRTEGKTGASARYLQDLEVNVISQEKCQDQWGYGRGRVEVGGPKMCFKSTGASCHGDSGGGMFIKNTSSLGEELIGVCSYGLADCQNWAPEVYTKVSYVIDWIRDTIKDRDGDPLNMEQCGINTLDTEDADSNSRRRRAWPGLDWMYNAASKYLYLKNPLY